MNNRKSGISSSVIHRLPRYYRFLGELMKQGIMKISSRELSEKMRLTASQIRQDLNCFGGFGQLGYGYNVEELHKEIAHILGLDNTRKVIIIGAGNLGRALAVHVDFKKYGYVPIGIFDSNPEMEGIKISGMPIMHTDDLEKFCAEHKPDMAVLCIPRTGAPDTVKRLMSYGVRAFWNFSHYDIHFDFPDADVENVHLTDSLMILSYTAENHEMPEELENTEE